MKVYEVPLTLAEHNSDIKGSVTFSVRTCPWFLEKTKVSQLFFYAQFYLFWVKYFMTVEIVFHF